MPKYVYKGDSPRSIPEYGIDRVEPGETVETLRVLEHPDFQPKAEVKATDKATEKEAETPVPPAQPASQLKVDKAKS